MKKISKSGRETVFEAKSIPYNMYMLRLKRFIFVVKHKYWWPAKNFPRNVYYFFQRGARGYSDGDWWLLADYLAPIIAANLKTYKVNKSGRPCMCEACFDSSLPRCNCDEEWNKILDTMILGFDMVASGDIDEWETMEQYKEKEAKVQEALCLFAKWYLHLWD